MRHFGAKFAVLIFTPNRLAMKKLFSLFLVSAPIGLLAQNPPLKARFEVEPGCGGRGRLFVQVECTEDPFDVMEVWLTRHELNERGERVLVDRMARRKVDPGTFVIANLSRGGYYNVWLQGCDAKVVSVETYGGDGCDRPGEPFAPEVLSSTSAVQAERPAPPQPTGRLVVNEEDVTKDVDRDDEPKPDVGEAEEAKADAADQREDPRDFPRPRPKRDDNAFGHSSTRAFKPSGSGGGSGGGTPQSGGAKTTGNMSAKPR